MKFICFALSVLFLTGLASTVKAQDYYASQRNNWLAKAENAKPRLNETIKRPTVLVNLIADKASFQGWKAVIATPVDTLYQRSFRKQNGIVVDFGEHVTGYVSFKLATSAGTADAPLRFKLTFGEVPSELATPFDPYSGGLSRAWLQDEVVDVMDVPATVTIARRLAFRYVKIELLGSSQNFDFKMVDISCKAVTSATEKPVELAAATPQQFKDIDRVGLNTLRECMQTVYEDGPKRDRRLWIGDLYLESLANNYSFKSYELTKRCLYLLAGLSGENGYLIGTVFENPEPHPQAGQYLMDYALLYNVALKEYLSATKDEQTANDLWPVAKRQLDIINSYVQANGLMNYEKANKEWWLFFDWKDGLDKQAALQGLAIYTLKQTYELAKALNKETELKEVPSLIKKMSAAGLKNLFNKQTGMFESGTSKQISYASQIWMVIAGVTSKQESQKALLTIRETKNALYPGAPYLYHYYVQALIDAGMNTQAKETVSNYWGGMIQKGADTFWEVYDPNNEFLSPYNFFPVNSYCHAWSCTPVYFIRKYPEIFQTALLNR
ncbi:alpha-L-rhamnosidase [Mucilaginibacter pineti]|uniref:Alpha-L-rhamnosidase n=1 Tax=Mucilaginibacter pineti TaxID=1391627 RepID=A0A1G6UCA1_9SPHI|nr:family 78 glycoside hydrolase catalytic domain [Mucilaginibacter pineti]SDD39020.1 alpha-L-rhamnosidase [Mucilaginibacter pineti]